jgi:hypothetical protein
VLLTCPGVRGTIARVTTFSLAIPHTPWRPERVASLARLIRDLAPFPDSGVPLLVHTERESHVQWTKKIWDWSAASGANYCVFLTDDTCVAPRFWDVLAAMIDANPGQILGLTSQDPRAPRLQREGHRWYTFCAWAVGWGYVMPRNRLVEFLSWREVQSPALWQEWGDDQLINIWCSQVGLKTWHPLPTIVDHDTSLESTVGHPIEQHGRREANTKVPWRDMLEVLEMTLPDYWRKLDAPHLTCADEEVWRREGF